MVKTQYQYCKLQHTSQYFKVKKKNVSQKVKELPQNTDNLSQSSKLMEKRNSLFILLLITVSRLKHFLLKQTDLIDYNLKK